MKKIILLFLIPFSVYAQFGEQQIIDNTILSCWSVSVADLDGDNFKDVLATDELGNRVIWYKNIDGLGTFAAAQTIIHNIEYPRYVYTADIDGDNDLDVFTTSGSSDLVVWSENLDGQGTFGPQQLIADNLLAPKMVIAGDVDGDSDLDVIIPSKVDSKVTWVENTDGQGTFGEQHLINNNGITPSSVCFTDINGDLIDDVVSDSSVNNQPCWYENLNGMGAFGSQQEITQDTSGSQYVLAEDIDDDDDLDVINLEFGGETLAWYENLDGMGTFGAKQIIAEPHAPMLMVMADLDNDDDKDILYISQEVVNPDFIAWQANDGQGNFGEQQIITTNVAAPRGLFAADIDNDGDIDVISSSISGENKITWYENLTILNIEDVIVKKIKVYPNPANTIINIENDSDVTIQSLELRDVKGQLIKSINKQQDTINISELATGIYFVSLQTNKGSVVKRIIKE